MLENAGSKAGFLGAKNGEIGRKKQRKVMHQVECRVRLADPHYCIYQRNRRCGFYCTGTSFLQYALQLTSKVIT
jgi:hypothetical protein